MSFAVKLEADFANNPGNAGAGTWDDLSSLVLSGSTSRGRQVEFDKYEVGTASFLLNNKSGILGYGGGLYNSVAGKLIIPGRKIRLSAIMPNMLANGSFESGITGWAASGTGVTIASSSTKALFGTKSLKLVTNGGPNDAANPNVTGFVPGQVVTVSCYINPDVTMLMNLQVNEADPIGTFLRFSEGGNVSCPANVWTRLTYTLTLGTSTTQIQPYVTTAGVQPITNVYIDGVQVEADWAATSFVGDADTELQFLGYAESWNPDRLPNSAGLKWDAMLLTVVDLFAPLSIGKQSQSRGVERSDVRVAAMLDAAGWNSTDRNLDVGQQNVAAVAYSGAGILTTCQDCEDAEAGYFFCTRGGVARFQNRYSRALTNTTSLATFSDVRSEIDAGTSLPYMDLELEYSNATIFNDALISASGGSGANLEWLDGSSEAQYFVRTVSKSTILTSDVEALSLAQYFVNRYMQPAIRIKKLMLSSDGNSNAMLAQMFQRDIGDRITIKTTFAGLGVLTKDYTIENIGHEITSEDHSWATTWAVAPADQYAYWVLDSATFSILDSTTRLGF